MTRQEIESEYDVQDGVIQSLGKFENEPVYTVYFWNCYLDGGADEDDGEVLTFEVTPEDVVMFPELDGYRNVFVWETDSGFVCSEARR